jgi:glycosyltransferase involved in cell wall biosynthesis
MHVVAPRYADEDDTSQISRFDGRQVLRSPEDRLAKWHDIKRVVFDLAPDYDLIHIQTPFAAHYAGVKAARTFNKPVITTYHTLFEEYLPRYIRFLPEATLRAMARSFSRRQCNAVDAVVVPSTAMRQKLLDYGVHAPMHVLPTGIPLDRFSHTTAGDFRARHGIANNRPVALFVGRIAKEKNIEFLLESLQQALTQQPDLLLVFAGDGPAMNDLKAQVKSLGLTDSVKLLGYVDRTTELAQCYAAADIFVFASMTETQGLVLLEAMAAGLPVVALAEMGTRDILQAQQGCITPAAVVTQFSDAMLKVLKDERFRQQLSKLAQQYALQWSEQSMAERMAALYSGLVSEQSLQAAIVV